METPQDHANTCPTPKGFKEHGLFGKPGFTFSEAFKYPADNWNVILWIATSIFIIITVIICFTLIIKHVRHYNKPIIQQHKLRILIYPPVYSILSWIAYIQIDYATTILFFASLFEAFAVFNLYTCLNDYLQPLREQMKDRKVLFKIKILGCINLSLKSKWGMHFRVIVSILVIQYPVWAILDAIISLIAQSQGYYCESVPSIHGAHVYMMVISFFSLMTILTTLIIYMRVFSDELKQENVPYMGMFWSIKLPIFIVFFFSTAVLSILEFNKIIGPRYSNDGILLWTPIQIKTAIKTTICCFAMFIASVMMIKYYNLEKSIPKSNADSTIGHGDVDEEEEVDKMKAKQVEVINFKKMSPGYAIIDAYFFYIPRFLYQIYLCGVDACHLFRKRREMRRKRKINCKDKNDDTTATTSEPTISSSSPIEIINDNGDDDKIHSLTDIHPSVSTSKANPSSQTSIQK